MRGKTAFTLMSLIVLAALAFQSNLHVSGLVGEVTIVSQQPLPASLGFKDVVAEVKVLNATYAEFVMKVEMENLSNQTLVYIVEVNLPRRYGLYPPGADRVEPQPRMEVKVLSGKGKLNVAVDRWGNARARGSVEACSEGVIQVEGWMNLVQSRHTVWRETIEGTIGFSIRPESGYAGPSERVEANVKLTYPKEYVKVDEINYDVKYLDGFKVIEYSEGFYGSLGLSLNLYKPRLPINSLAVFLALWVALVIFVVKRRREAEPKPQTMA